MEKISLIMMAFLVGALAMGCDKHNQRDELKDLETYAVYDAVIKGLFLSSNPQQVVIGNTTITHSLPEHMENLAVESELANDYSSRNAHNLFLKSNLFHLGVPAVLIEDGEVQRMGSFRAFSQRYPNSQGYMRLSLVGFNGQMTRALVYVGNFQGLEAVGYLVVLSKDGTGWVVSNKEMVWIT